MSQAQELPAAPSAVTALSGAEASGAASHSSDGNGLHSFGGQVSPRAARSQISTAVSFEGARAAGSAALPSRSLEEESALSAAEGDVEYSHSAEANQAAAGSVRPNRNGRLLRPSNSLMSTAVQPASPRLQQPVSPKLNRANSVVSHTKPGCRQHGGRAGTPASAYAPGQGFVLPCRARQQSPAQPLTVDQVEQTAAAAAAEQHRPGFAQLPPAWQHMPPAFPGLPDVTGQAAGQQTAILQSPQLQQRLNALHTMEQRDSFDGHHRSSDNGGGRRHGSLGYRGVVDFSGYQAAEAVISGSAANEAAGGHLPASAVALQPGTVGLQPTMQLFQNALAALPTAVAGGLLQGLLGQTGMGPNPVPSQGCPPSAAAAAPGAGGFAAAAAAATAGVGAAGHAAGGRDGFIGHRSPTEAASGNVGMSTDLLQQLQMQMTPALLAVLQGQATSDGHSHSQQVPGLPYTPQQLQQALSLLLAGLASQAGQYGIVVHGIGGSPAAAVQQQLPVQASAAGMRPPPAPVQAKSCDSSIAGIPASRQRECTRPAAAADGVAAASPAAPSSSRPRDLSPMAAAAAAAHATSGDIAARGGMQQPVPQLVPHGSAVGQQLQSMWLRQQHWRSPSPSPVPMGLAAARTSAAGEGHGSLNLGGLGSGCLMSQQGIDAAAGAISSAGGASRAGGGFTSEEGEADAPDALAAGAAADDAGHQGSIDAAGQVEDGSQPAGDGIQHGATSPSCRQQYAHAAAEPAAEQQQQHAGDHADPAASVHATMMSDGNDSGSESEADSGQSNAHSGGASRGATIGEQPPGPVAEVVSQPCGASHSASLHPSASTPAVATATGPASRSVLVGSGGVSCSRDVAAAVEPSAGPPGHATAAVEEQHRNQQPSAHRQHSNEHESGAEQGRQHRDSSLAMATAGPIGTRSGTVSTNSGTVDMSIHNDSQRSGAGSQGEAPAVGGWPVDDEMQDAVNSRDGEARGEPLGTYETAESGREGDNGYQAHHQHVQQRQPPNHPHEQRQQHVSAGSPVPRHSAAGQRAAAAAATHCGHADAAGIAHGMANMQQRRREQRQAVRFATASTPGDGCVGSFSLQGAYSSSDVGIPGVSAAGYIGALLHRQSSAAGNLSADQAVAAAYGSDHGVSVADEVDAGSILLAGAATGLQGNLPGSTLMGGVSSGAHRQPQPAAAEHVEHVTLHATFSVTSQLQPVGPPAAAAVLQHPPQLGHQHRHWQQQRGGLKDGCNMPSASHAQASEHGNMPSAADAVPQVTEIHGQFPNHSVPATAAAAQMAAAAAGHAQPQPDAHPQVTEMHGMLGASAGTAAGALLAAAAANGHLQNHAYSPGAAAAAAGLGATGSTVGDGGLPPLPHMHSIRINHSYHQRPQFAAPGSSRTGPAASNDHTAGQGTGLNVASPPPAAHQYGGQWGSNLQLHGHRAASVDAPQFAAHSRVHHSPPAVNFNPTAQGTGMANDTSQPMPLAVTPAMLAAAAPSAVTPVAADGATAGSQLHLVEQQPCPGSPSHAQGNSQLGQQDGSRGSPPAGMGRVGSVPPQDHSGTAGGAGEAGVVEQEPHQSRHSLSEDAGSHHQAADDLNQQQQQVEQEADGPSHAAGLSRQQGDSRSAVTSPAQQQRRHVNGFTCAAAAATATSDKCRRSWQRQPQQHWQQQQGTGNEGAGQVGGRAASMPFSLGQPEGSIAAGFSSKVYGSVSAGFASGSKAEGSPSYGAGLDGCSCGNAMVSGAPGHQAAYTQQQEDNEQDNQQQAQSHSTRRRRRPRDGPAGAAAAAAAAAGALQEGEGSHGSRSQEVKSCKRQRTSCEAASAQQPPRVTSSMQTTEA